VEQIFVHANRAELAELVHLHETGAISTRVAGTYPLDEAATAYQRLTKGGVRGRLVLVL
jgi:D-arabinose 1-dehydrogenase-like Zn-dependent alcohol dehydrogenase